MNIKKNQTIRRYYTLAWIIAVCVFFLPLAWAQAGEEINVNLTSRKVLTDKQGKETFKSADKIQPGDKIEYQAVYQNQGKGKVEKLMGIVPIPQGMEYIPESSKPAEVYASIDGKAFAPVPLKRTVLQQNGKTEIIEIPSSEYRFLRWGLGQLSSGKSVAVRARAMVSKVE